MRRHALPLLVLGAVALAAPLAATSQAADPAKPTYLPYSTGITGGEPSIGYDPKANAAIYGSGIKNVRMTWDPKDNPDPPGCTWFTTPPRPEGGS